MKRKPLPLLILLIIAHWCNYTQAQTTSKPVFKVSSNPSSCNGSDGSFVFSGLLPDTTYQVTYTNDDLGPQGPVAIKSTPSGELTINGLVAGVYGNFSFNLNGSISSVLTGQRLSNPINKAKFNSYPSFCAGSTPPPLPLLDDNGMSGTWNVPTVNNQTSGTYTFTPDPSTCGVPYKLTTVVIPNVTATFPFGTSLTICRKGTVPALPGTSTNGITGTWTPATIDTTQSGRYVFTPTSSGCVLGTTLTVTVNPNIEPDFPFGKSTTICAGAPVVTFPVKSTNNITGTWSPATVSNTTSGIYTFTPSAGQCATTTTYTVTVTPNVTPTFPAVAPICSGGTLNPLPATSNEGITGTWSPALNNTATTTYTFTPTAGQCATTATLTITVNPKVTPTFAAVAPICSGGTLNPLPTTSNEGITGTWSPALNNTTTTTYTFTPTAGQCAATTTLTITVNQKVTPTFPAVAPICSGATLAALPTTSNNGITGAWSPALNNMATTTYTFTPAAGQCATSTTLTITVNPNVTPTFTAVAPICSGATLAALPTISNNGITGAWSPALNNTATTTYTFTPSTGQCATTTTMTITVNPNVTPTFTAVAPICSGAALAPLPTISDNGITGTWAPALNNTATTTYTFTPSAGQCATTTTLTITVNQKVTPTFPAVAPICTGAALQALPVSSTNAKTITGAWSPVLNNTATTTYTFTPDTGQCANASTLTIQVYPKPAVINIMRDTTVYDGTVLPPYNFSVNDPAGTIKWNNSNPAIGLAASGAGPIPSFRATNMADSALNAIIVTVPFTNGCAGVAQSFKIKVLPLAKDVFVPNVFSPDGDGKNDQLFIYGNYIASAEMQIFNQWGQHMATLTGTNQGWDGKYRGSAQPVGVYLYVLRAVLKDGRTVRAKGSITLIR